MERAKGITVTFTDSEFISLLQSTKFARALKTTATHVRRTGHEAGFSVHTLGTRKTHIPYMILSSRSDSLTHAEWRVLDEEPGTGEACGVLFDFHFHPDSEAPIIPSTEEGDLTGFSDPEAPSAVMGIGRVRLNRDIDMLIMKPKSGIISLAELDELNNLHPELTPQSQVIDIMERNGIQAFLIKYVLQGSRYMVDEDSITKLSQLGNTKVSLSTIPEEFLGG